MSAAAERDALLAELLTLWSEGGGPVILIDGQRIPRSQRERELIRALRPACYAAHREVAAAEPAPPKTKPKKRGRKGSDAPASKTEADPA